ncbi:NADH dehydrogenase [Abditibacterium utsteinense]|uniref:NADH:ubiquinone reductase (non-electrogenic) n=1 Tax=Abditibacterium utsteinense TaxID=1960156 RepID=A0A2S8STG6_9BACT|nr:NAD(P)/FAD-dependent oxidoreductase [Abditibacterium utsteinense]PQV64076.1 NADH dehydrogenase [Abditibacterium utsteinense]
MATSTGRPKVVIIGAGFGGLSALKTFGHKAVDVLLVDRNNYHGFWPLLYQVATGQLDSASIAYPIRNVIQHYKNTNFQLADVTGVDFAGKMVQVQNGEPISYDYLILAAGSAQFYFGNDVLAETTFSMKDVDQAEELRNHVLAAFEKAQTETDPEKRKKLMTIAIVGGGPTGVELAGAYVELFKYNFKRDFPNLDMSQAKVALIEAMGTIMMPFSDPNIKGPSDLQLSTAKVLESRGVEIMLNAAVESVADNVVSFKDGRSLAAGTVIWAAGVRGAMLGDKLGIKLQRGFRVQVNEDLTLPEHPDVYVVGDMAYLEGFKWGERVMAYPQVAQVAIQMAKKAAENIMVRAAGGMPGKFKYNDKGSMAIIGRNAAIVSASKPVKIKMGTRFGTFFPGWIMWLAVHVMFLEGWRNKWVAIFNWIWNWFGKDRGARILTGKVNEKTEKLIGS